MPTGVVPCSLIEPQVFEDGIVDQFLVLGDGLFSDWMHHSITVFFDVHEGICRLLVIWSKREWDCIGWGVDETEASDVVQGLPRNSAGCSA